MLQAVILVVIAAAVLLWLRRAPGRPSSGAATRPPAPASDRFHCVEVRPGLSACDAARRIGTVRFLASEAPMVPLPGCDEPRCGCRYVHHGDRRFEDRRNPYGQWTNLPTGLVRERRRRVERRQSNGPAVTPSIRY